MAERSVMSLLAAGVRKESGMSMVTDARGLWGPIRESFAGAWQRNITVEGVGSLFSYSPVFACATRIASDIAKLLLELMVDDGNGILDRAPSLSPFWQVLRKPNHFQNRIQFIRHWQLCKLIFGNAYALKERDGRGIVTALYLLDPRGCQPLVTPLGDVYYSLSGNDLAHVPSGRAAAPASEIIHDRGATPWHPLVGVPPLVACAISGALGLAIQRNSVAFFANMSRPSGLITGPKTIDPVTALRLKTEWEANYSQGNVGRTAVMGDNLDYKAMSVAAEQSQLAEQLGISAVDVATAFGMPAYKINQGPMPTSNNVAALQQQYYNDALHTNIEDLELCLTEGLAVPDGYSVECNLDGLLRMDSATQMDVLAKGVGGAILKPDEARAKLNRRPVAGGNAVYLQQQNYSLAALDKRDSGEDPFKTAPAPAPAPAAPAPNPAPAAKELDLVWLTGQIAEAAARAVAAMPVPRDGVDFDPVMLKEAVRLEVAAIPRPADGRDFDPAALEVAVARHIADLPPAPAGRDADPEQVRAVVQETLPPLVEATRTALAAELDAATQAAVDRRVSEAVQRAMAALPAPQQAPEPDEPDLLELLAKEFDALSPA